MKASRYLLLIVLLTAAIAVPVAAMPRAGAQGPMWPQVWFFPQEPGQPALIEYRDANGAILASYALASDSIHSPRQGGGYVYGWDLQSIPIFNPFAGMIQHYVPPVLPESSDSVFYNLSEAIPAPTGLYAYAVTQQDMQNQAPALNQVYVATPGRDDDRLVFDQPSQDAWTAIQPLGWNDDGTVLLLHDMPQGIGGYILFWRYQNVRALDVASGNITSLGSLSSYSGDLALTADIDYTQDAPSGILVTDTATGQVTSYPLPPLPEPVSIGGGASFSPGKTWVAYQVARGNPEAEKFYTIVVNLATGESRVVLEDESTNYEIQYGHIAGWLNETALVVGEAWSGTSTVIDVTTGQKLRDEFGAFLGYAQGVSSTGSFAPAGTAYTQCPGAPVSRLAADARGRITYTNGSLTNVRYWAGLDADIASQLPEGAAFTVLYGPTCVDGFAWWNVQFDSGVEGYVAEGTTDEYFLEPLP